MITKLEKAGNLPLIGKGFSSKFQMIVYERSGSLPKKILAFCGILSKKDIDKNKCMI
jgi:hypothetical protein